MATIERLCPKCNSEKVIFAGYNNCKSGKKQRLKCQSCGSKFQQNYSLASYTMQEKSAVAMVDY